MPKIDEQISYNWLFFLLAGAFGAVTFWAVYDETATRREYKGYQETFFTIETNLAEKAWTDAKKAMEATPEWKKAHDEVEKVSRVIGKRDPAAPDEKLIGPKAEEYHAAWLKLRDLEFDAFDKQQNYTFTKSNLDESYYFFTLAKHDLGADDPTNKKAHEEYEKRKKEFDEKKEKLDKLTAKLAEDEAKMNESAQTRDCAKKGRSAERPTCNVLSADDFASIGYAPNGKPVAVEAYTQAIDRAAKTLEDIERPTKELERKFLAAREKHSIGPLGLFGPDTEILQQNLEEIDRVDRCESCHVGANRGGFETVTPNHFRSHPYRRTLLAIHPVEKFGCTTCHDGQGRATTRFYAHAPTDNHHYAEKHFWEFPLLKGPYVESECRQCHRSEYDLRANLRCESDTECPKGLKCAPLAAALNPSVNLPAGPELKPEEGKYCGNPDGGDDTKIDPVLVDLAPHLARGRKIIEEVACYGCHPIEGYEN